MDWLLQLDIGLFRLINETGSNPIFDQIMPFVSGNAFFYPALVILGVLLICKGRSRGIICILMLALSVGLCDGWICRLIKDVVARPRPFLTLSDVHCLIGKGGSFSMPSSHAANWFAAVMVAAVYYRRSLWFMLPASSATHAFTMASIIRVMFWSAHLWAPDSPPRFCGSSTACGNKSAKDGCPFGGRTCLPGSGQRCGRTLRKKRVNRFLRRGH